VQWREKVENCVFKFDSNRVENHSEAGHLEKRTDKASPIAQWQIRV
jgi:hypothetical protein